MQIKRMPGIWGLLTLIVFAVLALYFSPFARAESLPNIVLVMTDDQGYGDLGAHGNDVIRTPHLDALYKDSIRFTDFHVSPTCSPTRAALMTGMNAFRAGVWHTNELRHVMPTERTTLAEILKAVGYKTGLFGKWHLGDNYPFRAQDQGFDHFVMHGGGGVGQTPDYWANDQFDDVYDDNGTWRRFEGYATDIWFDETIDFINKNADTPFFAYVSTNAPHEPWIAPEAYVQAYRDRGIPERMAQFYAMITNIDDNIGKLINTLNQLALTENTIFIFMTDNGSALAQRMSGEPLHYLKRNTGKDDITASVSLNAGMRGGKVSLYEGGHRVPLFVRWPAQGLDSGRDIKALAAHYDILPTLLDYLGLASMAPAGMDGISLRPSIENGHGEIDRKIVLTQQQIDRPLKDRPWTVIDSRWRLIQQQGKMELYDIRADLGQTENVIARFPEVATELKAYFNSWWEDASKGVDTHIENQRIVVGHDQAPVVRLTGHDWPEPNGVNGWGAAVWPGFVPLYSGWIGNESSYTPQPWPLRVQVAGTYRVRLFFHDDPADKPIDRSHAVLNIGEKRVVRPVPLGSTYLDIYCDLDVGTTDLSAWFSNDPKDKSAWPDRPAFYVYVSKADGQAPSKKLAQ